MVDPYCDSIYTSTPMVPKLLVPPHDLDLADQLRNLAARSFPAHLQDDRFELGFLATNDDQQNFRSAVVQAAQQTNSGSDGLAAFVGGFIDGDTLHVDTLVDTSIDKPADLLVETLQFFRESVTKSSPTLRLIVWTKPTFDWHEDFAASAGLVQDRSLLQMRAPLPTGLAPLDTRAFVPGVDNEALRNVNNRAFASHPDQGNQTAKQFDEGLDQAWVNPEGIRLYEVNGVLAGFCWTKIHRQPDLGEIYVIGIDPDFHGQGLGKPMTAAGLSWLHDQGLETSMLYVEADNTPARITYERLGFQVVRTDKSWIPKVSSAT